MLAIKHPSKEFYVMFGCRPCVDEHPGSLGGFVSTHDESIRLWHTPRLPKTEISKLADETLKHHKRKPIDEPDPIKLQALRDWLKRNAKND